MKVLLGTNEIRDCSAVLHLNGAEVFRLRHGATDGQLLCDFDLFSAGGDRLAKVAKNQVVHIADGYSYQSGANAARILDPHGAEIAKVERLSDDCIKIAGRFHVGDLAVTITDTELVSGGVTFTGNTVIGMGRGIVIGHGGIALGAA